VLVHDAVAIMAAGLPALAAHLTDHGFATRVWDLRSERLASIERDLARDLRGVRLLGISVHWFYQLPAALDLARRARKSGFEGFIVLGGFTASLFAAELVRDNDVLDGVLRGDGERPLLALARQVHARRPRLDRVENLVYRSRGRVRRNAFSYVGSRERIDALDFGRLCLVDNLDAHLAWSSWREITDGSRAIHARLSPTFYLCGGRGCSVACATCGGGRNAHRAHSRRRSVAFRSPGRIVDDVEQALEYGVGAVHACFDPAPNGPHWHAFMDGIEERGIRTNMIFESFSLPDRRFLERFAAVFSEGLVVISPETASERVRRRIRGFPFTNRELTRTLELVVELGLSAQVFLGYFAPTEGLAGLHRSRAWARHLAGRFGPAVEVLHYPFSTDPGSPLQRRPGSLGMRCSLRGAADYLAALESLDPWLDNLMCHAPGAGTADDWRAASLGVELEQAVLRSAPRIHGRLAARLGTGIDRYFLSMARRWLRSHEPQRLDRSRLADILRAEVIP
jgi:radical SAM superfamily enzyme YgiQ (UPF0313 family)